MCFALYAGCSRRYTHEKHIKKTLCSDSAGSDWLSLTDTRQVKFKEQITSSYFELYELSVFKLAEEASTATPIKNTRK